MTGNEIRARFLKYFASKGHAMVSDSSLLPQDDPTLLFTNAGMVQFKRLFMGEEKREYIRAATCQRCVRAGGKHNDLENVGHTARHHTFFEMLGNFSFGDYFKEDAIHYAWDFLINILGLPAEKMWVSVFKDDDEAFRIWEKVDGLPRGRIVRMGEKDNFWSMGDTGPCGPCSELHIDQGPEVGCGRPDCNVECECDRFLELWNLVFMQFYRDESGRMTPLPKPSIDTGMGLERVAAVVQQKRSNYESDLFTPIINCISSLCGKAYGADSRSDTAMRVMADHCRATAFLVADGMLPANEGRGYVLRRIMRRAIRFGRSLDLKPFFLNKITSVVLDEMSSAYPHLLESRSLLSNVVNNEEERFQETLDNGLDMLSNEIFRLRKEGGNAFQGDFIFKLYDTYGFPLDIVRDVAMEQGLAVDETGFIAAMEEQRQRSKKSWKGGELSTMAEGVKALMDAGHKAIFVGYEQNRAVSTITGMINQAGKAAASAGQGEIVSIFCPTTPFYAEAGGQIGDQGMIAGPRGKAKILNTITVADGLILHESEIVAGVLSIADRVELAVSEGRRLKIACNHTATHILHAALRSVLGDHVRQSGSLVTPDRLRFDYTHFSKPDPEQIKEIELIANREIRADTGVCTDLLNREEAIKDGATALFGEKYGDTVRVVSLSSFSKELCGGTHVSRTGEIGLVKIISETGIAAGVRRIEAVTGQAALTRYQELVAETESISGLLKTPFEELRNKISQLLVRQKELEKELGRLTAKLTLADLDSIIGSAIQVGGVRVIAADIVLDSPKTLREVGDRIRDKLGSGVVVLGGVYQEKAALLVMVTKDLTPRLHAGSIIKEIAVIVGGSGGGRADMAQAGGPELDKLSAALAAVGKIISRLLS